MKKIFYMTCLAVVVLFSSCNDTMDDKSSVDGGNRVDVGDITFAITSAVATSYNAASVTFSVDEADVKNVFEIGVEVDTDPAFPNPSMLSTTEFEAENEYAITDLEAETTYYVRPFVMDVNQEVHYGAATSFTTEEAPEVIEETWTPQFIGTYTYSVMWDVDDEGLVLNVSDLNGDRYKIEHWGYDVDFIFEFNEDGTISVPEQDTGSTYGDYGSVYVASLDQYFSDYDPETDASYYSGGKFYFNVVYYVQAGYIDYGEETFTLTANYSADVKKNILRPFTKPVFKSGLTLKRANKR